MLAHWCDLKQACEAIGDTYHGCYTSVTGFAQEMTEETTEIPDRLRYYIDYEGIGLDTVLSGDIYTIEGNHDAVHVFWMT